MTRQQFQPVPFTTESMQSVALMVTRRCNMTCGHCSVESRPGIRDQPTEAELLHRVRGAIEAGVRWILFTGGEPMMREALLLRLMKECYRNGVGSRIATNGFWGKTLPIARRRLKALRKAGLVSANVSYDRYHAEFQGPEPALNIAHAAADLDIVINIAITRVADDPDLEKIVEPFRNLPNLRLRFYDVQPVGLAKNLAPDSLRSEVDGFCSACSVAAITDDGRMTACNGPSYFAKDESPLSIGSLDKASVADLARIHRTDPVLDTIRTHGPSRLRAELLSIPGFEDFPFKSHYHGMCELCHHINGNAEVVAALRTRLSEERFVAERAAVRRVMKDHKRAGVLNRKFANGIGGVRSFLHAATAKTAAERWTAESQQILGRADLDWNHLANYLTACGMAIPLISVLDDEQLSRWTPTFFRDRIRKRAVHDEMRELARRQILRDLASLLRQRKTPGILLKGSARVAMNLAAGIDGARAAGDIDILVDSAHTPWLYDQLIKAGFAPKNIARVEHHLQPLHFRGVWVEIHDRIMSPGYGLPEAEMRSRTVPVNHDDFQGLCTLDPEGMFLHAAVHCTSHLFAFGLKTGWDLQRILDRHPNLDWERLTRWAAATKLSRAFWVPLSVLADELDFPIPFEFLQHGPRDARQRKLEVIARRRLFRALDQPKDIDVFSRVATFSMLRESLLARVGFLLHRGWRTCRRGRISTGSRQPGIGLAQSAKTALSHWKKLRHGVAADDTGE